MTGIKNALIILFVLFSCMFAPSIGVAVENEIRIADQNGDWGHPSPYLAYGRGPGYLRMHFIFDTLVWKNETSDIIPLLAENWEYIPEEEVYIFNLAKNAKWHDGEPVTANDVAFTIEYMKEHPYGWVVLDSVDRAEVVDEHTVKIYMNGPYVPFMEDIGGTMPIMPEHIWKDVEDPMDYVQPDAFIGSGPFKYVDFSKEHGTYHYEAFNEYHLGKPNIDRLIYVKAGDPQMALQRGEVDFASIKPEMAETLTEDGFVVIAGPHYWNKNLMINHNKKPLDNIMFRQALAYAIDQDEFVDKSLRGYGKPASYGLISSESQWANPDVLDYPYDPDKAKEMISSLGYELKNGIFYRGNEPLAFEVLVSKMGTGGQSTPDRDGEILKNQLEKIGIQIDLISLETKIVDQKVINWNFDLAISGHGGIGGDPKILYEKVIQVPGSKASPNTARYDKSEELNSLLDDLMHEMDPVKRQEAVYEAQNIYARELPAISLYYPTWYYAYNPDAGVEWFYTLGGIAKGIPIPQNKMAMIGSHAQEKGEIMQAVAAMQTTDDTQDTPIMPFFAVFAILTVFFLKRSGRKT
ncbi:MAG TPA: ABC transporter substrate-binding protein [Candidatus Nanoarchaeia archaeon]|nr:ABC transporter substrate-binding protein [Candidatus Nanoarchaeia archaeon]